jgi:hypothetical protein
LKANITNLGETLQSYRKVVEQFKAILMKAQKLD